MTAHKNQHYVPQSYLRHFSQDGTGLYRYFLKDGVIKRSSIEKTCANFWFYAPKGTSADFEATLSGLETQHAAIIQEILDARSLNVVSSKNQEETSFTSFLLLCNFILLTETRTKLSKQEGEAAINLAFDLKKQNLAQSKEARELGITQESIDRLKLGRASANLESMLGAMVGAHTISDLGIALLVNKTDRPFITSDAPVVLYNFLKIDNLSMLGWQSPGLMMFVPLSEECALWLFDVELYEPSVKVQDNLLLAKGSDIDELNRIQILNADEYVILSKPDYREYISLLHKPLQRRRRTRLFTMETQAEFDVGEKHSEIFVTRRVAINYNLHLSFFKKNKSNARAFVDTYEKAYKERIAKFGYNKPFVLVRNEKISASFEAQMEKVRKNIPEN
jgi:hypothetical protein